MSQYKQSEQLFAEASKYIPGGVNSPVRAFKSVSRSPLFIDHGIGGHIFDVDGNEYIDFISSWGPLILGHANPKIIEAIKQEVDKGTSYGACNINEIRMAEKITQFFPSIEKVRMVNSGTEATMSAVRLARGYTGRNKIVKLDGCYHGHADMFLIKAGSGLATFGTSSSSGVTQGTIADTLIADYNDIASIEQVINEHPDDIAAVILEPIMGNMGLITPENDFLQELRILTEKHGILLIFDEVISGFRSAKGGAQELYGITPDLTCLGKIIGGGLPVGAFGGRTEIMDHLSPNGPVYQAGTLSGNPVAMAAGVAMLEQLETPDFFDQFEAKGAKFEQLVREAIAPYAKHLSYNRSGSLSTLFFKAGGVKGNADSKESNTELYARYFNLMLEQGIYLPPSQFECMFLSAAHSPEDLQRTANAMAKALATLFQS